jgi:hypothetical protein
VRRTIDAFYEHATQLGLEIKRKPVDEGGEYVGTTTCKACHTAAALIHDRSLHAHALERLRAKDPKRAGLPECLRCHTTGLGYDGGFHPGEESDAGGLGQVGCESCHGVGADHVADHTRPYGRPFRQLSGWRERCAVCHDRSNSPKFDISAYLARIKHWSDERR